MSAIKVVRVSTEFETKKGKVMFQLPSGSLVSVHNISHNPPGEQSERELRKLAIEAALNELREVIADPPA